VNSRYTLSALGAVLAVVVLLGAPVRAGEAHELTEAEKMVKFLAGFHSWSPAERRQALQILSQPEFHNNREIGRALYDIAWFNKDPEVRLAAFQNLCSWYDADGSLAYHLARLFKHELEPLNKPPMAQAMTRLEFKTDVLNELVFYLRLLGGSDDYWGWENSGAGIGANAGGGVGGGGGGSGAMGNRNNNAWDRAHYRAILNAINKISGKHFVASYDTPRQLLNWWRMDAIDYQHNDHELVLKQQGKNPGQGMAVQFEVNAAKAEPVPGDILTRKVVEKAPKPKGIRADEDEIE
jgi:hypothetical protein